jgi:hypothetical protein
MKTTAAAGNELGQSTLGELIVALTDEAGQIVRDEREVYRVVAYIVTDLLNKSRLVSRTEH